MKRFYRNVEVAAGDGGWQVQLDGRGLKTIGGKPQLVPSHALAEALAQEWAEQGEEIDPACFILRDQADYAIDIVAPDRDATIATLLGFGETDTLCYRADPDEPLYPRQLEEWEPLVERIEARHAMRFTRISGIIHRPQPPETLAQLHAQLEEFDPFTLAGLHGMASLAASLCIALLALEEDADAASLWRAASLEEEWQADLWGREEEAEARRAKRQRDFLSAEEFVRLARS
ncbi:molecular chaperone [Altererythrobacter sp. BO-6]|uniref:ATP12 family chaperone protein n=1 Tax=Altererythrobacter sp. BO-6 TaxID=2604537 RepID=UPI0013E1C208|nr:ATP12 family protein [Altererythrobacter sp. BO-6]QIG54810.1 molecular chaperone [Altererythrobacter sp. BO-6]